MSSTVTNGETTLQSVHYEYTNKLPTKTTTRMYNAAGDYIETIEAAEYDGKGNVTAQWSSCAAGDTTVSYNRDYVNNKVTVTDENGGQVTYIYTPLGLEYETVDTLTNLVINRKEYDAQSRLAKYYDYVYGAVTVYTYDVLGRVTAETVRQDTTALTRTTYACDDAAENGLYQKVTKTVVGDANATSIVTTQYTDKHGNVVKTGKFLGGVEYFDTSTYDYVGNVLTTLTAADAQKNLDYTAQYVYNGTNQVVTA